MKTPTRKDVTNAECTTAVLGLFTRSVPTWGSPKNVCVRTLPLVFILLGLHPSVFLGIAREPTDMKAAVCLGSYGYKRLNA